MDPGPGRFDPRLVVGMEEGRESIAEQVAGVERGVDLAGGLLALSEDLREARREQLHKDAVRRRAAMLVPTIGILAPIMLLFIAAPLPSIVLGHR